MNDKIKRIKRYREKIEFIIDKIENIPEKKLTPLEKDGVFYRLIIAIESAMDLVAMTLKDMGKQVEDNYSNISKLSDVKKFPSELAQGLKKCNGLRNILVHRYNSIEEKIALESIDEIKNILYKLIEYLESFLIGFRKDKK